MKRTGDGGGLGRQGDLFGARPTAASAPPVPERAAPAPEAAPPGERAAPVEAAPAKPPKPRVYSVGEAVRAAARAVEAPFSNVWIAGEISGCKRHSSGHLYFQLKDDDAQLPVVMWRSDALRVRFDVSDGMQVRVRGRLTIYEQQGKFQMYASAIEPVGAGEAALAFEQLKKKLAAEGLFAEARKRPLPFWPRRIGVVTSPTGAAVRDIIRVVHRRAPIPIVIAPAAVQGDSAPWEICAALDLVVRVPDVDVVIVGRGGGSAEDLACFNDERVARAIAACPRPVISAVGHEIDVTIADFVADVRAPTPSAAAERAVPVAAEVRETVLALEARLLRGLHRARDQHALTLERLVARLGDPRRLLERAREQVEGLAERQSRAWHQLDKARRLELTALEHRLAGLHPRARLAENRGRLTPLEARLPAAARRLLSERRGRVTPLADRLPPLIARLVTARRAELGRLASRLDALSPLRVLERGYSLVRGPDGHLVTDAAVVEPGQTISVELRRGHLAATVTGKDDK